jgi:hypothetical protein
MTINYDICVCLGNDSRRFAAYPSSVNVCAGISIDEFDEPSAVAEDLKVDYLCF